MKSNWQTGTVQLVNPWSGACPPEREMSWYAIKKWARECIHFDYRREWLNEARQAFKDGDGEKLGIMIIGS